MDFADIQIIMEVMKVILIWVLDLSSEDVKLKMPLDALSNPLTEAKLTNAKRLLSLIFVVVKISDLKILIAVLKLFLQKLILMQILFLVLVIDPFLGDKGSYCYSYCYWC